MQGASPLASPGAEPGRHWLSLRGRCPAGGWLFQLPDLPAVAVIVCPHPPYPALAERSSRREGGKILLISPGASPSAPLRLSRERHWERGRSRHRRGAVPGAAGRTRRSQSRQDGITPHPGLKVLEGVWGNFFQEVSPPHPSLPSYPPLSESTPIRCRRSSRAASGGMARRACSSGTGR